MVGLRELLLLELREEGVEQVGGRGSTLSGHPVQGVEQRAIGEMNVRVGLHHEPLVGGLDRSLCITRIFGARKSRESARRRIGQTTPDR